MINAKHEALNRYALLTGFIGLLFVPLLVALFAERWFPPHRGGETVNVPRYMNNAVPIAFSLYEVETRIQIHLPAEGETYLGRHRVTREDLIDGIKKLKAARPADAGIIYLKAGVGISHGNIVETLKTIRAAGSDRVRLVVKRKAPDGGNENGTLEVKLQVEPAEERDYAKIDPLMLVVSVDGDGTLRLNRMRIGAISDTKELASTLSDVFSERETVPGAAQEKTVFIKGSALAKYDHVARLLDVIAGTGARPIIMQLDKDLPARLPPPKPAGDKLSLRP